MDHFLTLLYYANRSNDVYLEFKKAFIVSLDIVPLEKGVNLPPNVALMGSKYCKCWYLALKKRLKCLIFDVTRQNDVVLEFKKASILSTDKFSCR